MPDCDVTLGSEEGGRGVETVAEDRDFVVLPSTTGGRGAYEALRSVGRDETLIISVDGGCVGVRNVETVIGATSMQFPLLTAGASRP
jgi:fructose transport system substrate-binding protein